MAVITRKSWVFQGARALGTLYGNKSLRHHDGIPVLKRKLSNGKESKLEALVTFGESKRIIRFKKGDDLKTFRHHFLRAFSDILSEDVAPGNVKFQKFDHNFNEYVEVKHDLGLEENDKLKAIVILKNENKAAQISSAEIQQDMEPQQWPRLWPHCHVMYSWFPIYDVGPGSPMFLRPHPIKKNTTYQLWSPVSKINDGCIERDSQTNIVNCKGNFNGGINTVMKAIDETRILTFYVALQFKNSSDRKDYVLTGNAEGQDITSTEVQIGVPLDDKCIFLPLYYWSYTMFQNKNDKNLYLGCDHTGKATLVKNADLDYPNPQALFILKRVVQVQ